VEARGERRTTIVAVTSVLVALAAMAVDHLVGTERGEDEGLVDPTTFTVSAVLSLVVAVLLFGWFVPRERSRGPGRAARSGLVCSVLAVVPGIAVIWLGFPFVVAGAGIALGLEGRQGPRRSEATAAVAVGGLALALGAAAYVVAAVV
jgi:hypothetical protein